MILLGEKLSSNIVPYGLGGSLSAQPDPSLPRRVDGPPSCMVIPACADHQAAEINCERENEPVRVQTNAWRKLELAQGEWMDK